MEAAVLAKEKVDEMTASRESQTDWEQRTNMDERIKRLEEREQEWKNDKLWVFRYITDNL